MRTDSARRRRRIVGLRRRLACAAGRSFEVAPAGLPEPQAEDHEHDGREEEDEERRPPAERLREDPADERSDETRRQRSRIAVEAETHRRDFDRVVVGEQ